MAAGCGGLPGDRPRPRAEDMGTRGRISSGYKEELSVVADVRLCTECYTRLNPTPRKVEASCLLPWERTGPWPARARSERLQPSDSLSGKGPPFFPSVVLQCGKVQEEPSGAEASPWALCLPRTALRECLKNTGAFRHEFSWLQYNL